MNTKKIFLSLMMTMSLALSSTGVGAQSKVADCRFCQKITGAWNVVITATEVQLKELLTFAPGATDDEGTVTSSNELDSFACSSGQGVWVRTGLREYATTHTFFCFDPEGNPGGTAKVREAITLSEDGNSFTGRLKFEVFDPEGNSVGGDEATVQGARLRVEPIE